jgi:NAD(P)-dependent dehydrogenase (short-subunit alcohol dehydrogenase family)
VTRAHGRRPRRRPRVFVTGSADGLGRLSARTLPERGHEVVVHARNGPDGKLFATTLAAAVARLWEDVCSNAVDPGWVPTRMGGPGATDDPRLGHLTQEWLATSGDPHARTSGGYWRLA